MAIHGWMINLSDEIPVYSMLFGGVAGSTQIGKILKNECFVEGTNIGAGWEGENDPVYFLNPQYVMTYGAILNWGNFVDFSAYASNGSSWEKVNTYERKVEYKTRAYYANGDFCCDLPTGSRVWLTQNCSRGDEKKNFVAVTDVETDTGKKYHFQGNGFIDLTYDNRYVTVGSILLRKA